MFDLLAVLPAIRGYSCFQLQCFRGNPVRLFKIATGSERPLAGPARLSDSCQVLAISEGLQPR